MKALRKKEGQKGFTLIEIIAVLVLLGILAAVAIPRFFSLQDDARAKTAEGIAANIASGMSITYARALLQGDETATVDTSCDAYASLDVSDDFDISCSAGDLFEDDITITVEWTVGAGGSETRTWTVQEDTDG